MLPGLFIDRVIVRLKGLTNLVSLALLCLGLAAFGVFHHRFPLLAGAAFAGLGYGIMQPVIYDKAATIAPPRSATLALSFVMAMNYLAVVACPFIVDAFRSFSTSTASISRFCSMPSGWRSSGWRPCFGVTASRWDSESPIMCCK